MGNTKSNTQRPNNATVPLKPALKKRPGPGPANRYNYNPTEYIPQQYPYPPTYPPNYPPTYSPNYPPTYPANYPPTYPANYPPTYPPNYPPTYPANYPPTYPPNYPPTLPQNHPIGYIDNYRPNDLIPQPRPKSKVPQQQAPSSHHNRIHYADTINSHSHPHHYQQQQPSHEHHNHHHRSTTFSEKERFGPPILTERATSPGPPVQYLPSALQQKPVSSITTYKIDSPVANKEPITPPPPRLPPQQKPASSVANKEPIAPLPPVHHSASVPEQKPMPSVLIEKPSIPVVVNKQQTSSPSVSNNFKKAPAIVTNSIPKPLDNHSIHRYGLDPIPIVRRSNSRLVPSGNKWYDHDYDKRVQSLTGVYD